MIEKIKFNLESLKLLFKFKKEAKKRESIAVDIIKEFHANTKN